MSHARAMIIGLVLLTAAGGAMADPEPATAQDLGSIYQAYDAAPGSESAPVYGRGEGGYLSNVVATGGSRFRNDAALAKNANTPGAAALAFMDAHKSAFGVKSSRSSFSVISETPMGDMTVVKLQQEYDGVPVFGGQFNVQLDPSSDVLSIISDPMRDTGALDRNFVRTSPTIQPSAAANDALDSVRQEYGSGSYHTSEPEVIIYDPSVAGAAGEPRLAYRTHVHDANDHEVEQDVFVDAHTGNVLLSYSLICTAQSRYIYDLRNSTVIRQPGVLERVEGGPPSSVDAVNLAYDLVGDTYEFYLNEHGRDGINGFGGNTFVSVRLPVLNAFWDGTKLIMGTQLLTDDILAHEYTHGVTDYTSNLVYLFESGAINESMSDIWGEFVDFTYDTFGDDSPEVRWKIGEDSGLGVIRDMSDPTLFGDPDRYSARFILPAGIDNGGVHINSGIGNKLCYLLTDGSGIEGFNGYVIEGMGVSRVADLYYRTQFNLTPLSNYEDLYFALVASAISLGWEFLEVENLQKAAKAVEIFALPDGKPLRHMRAQSEVGSNSITLTWKNPQYPFTGVQLVRNATRFPISPSDGTLLLNSANATSFVDNTVTPGTQYYYGVFVSFAELGTESDFAQAVVNEGLPLYAAEQFDALKPNDLSFKQVLYSPTGDIAKAFESSRPTEYVTFHDYSATIKSGVQQLPIRRINGISLNLPNDETVTLPDIFIDKPILFFGQLMNRIRLSANGFITPADVVTLHFFQHDDLLDFPSLASHWDVPRISFLFNDLIPAASGDIWVENLPDRLVITFEEIRQFGSSFPPPDNTAQVEVFYSGHIRVTYLSLESPAFIAGLSDGRGIPFAPSELGNPTPTPLGTNLDALPAAGALSIDPIPASVVAEGALVAFVVSTSSADTSAVTLSVANAPVGSTFDTSTGVFQWRTDSDDAGAYQPVFTATQGTQIAKQNALIIVNDLGLAPTASNLVLTPTPEAEDDDEIRASYDYASPDGASELGTEIFWYRNSFLVSALYNSLVVPPEATTVGDFWSVAVLPRDPRGLTGAPIFSEEITIVANTKADINEDGVVNAVDIQLVINAVLGKGLGALNPDANIDGAVNSIDIQTVINRVLE